MTGGNSNEREAGWVVFAGLNGRAEHRDTARGVGRGVRVRGWRIVGEFEDRGISGAKGREKRPGFDRLLKAATTHKIDVVAAWSVDRLGARCRTLSGSSENSARSGAISILSGRRLTRPPQPATPSSKCSGFAEFERSIIQERVKAGMARARKHRTRSGKPIGQPPISQGQGRGDPSRAGARNRHPQNHPAVRDRR